MTENDPDTSEARQILEGISTCRQASAGSAGGSRATTAFLAARDHPDGEIVYTINPPMLPLTIAPFTTLRDLLKEKYGVRFVRPDLGPIGPEPHLADDDLGAALLRAKRRVRFQDGKFMRTGTDFDLISSINIDSESIRCAGRE